MLNAWGTHLRSQFWASLPYPERKWTGQTIIITGSNCGIGLEAAIHFVRLDAAKVILAVRSTERGDEAAQTVEQSTGRKNVVEVWQLDLADYKSVLAFADRVSTRLDRLDVIVCNAAKYTWSFEKAGQDESTITVNVVSTMLLAILMLPKLRETSLRFQKETVLTSTGSFMHNFSPFVERTAPGIFDELNNESSARMSERYNTSKLIQLLATRELAAKVAESSKKGNLVVNIVNPGQVHTNIMREANFLDNLWITPMSMLMSRTAEEGGRTLVHGAEGGKQTHGQYFTNCQPANVSPFVSSPDGQETQRKLWSELVEKLEKISPGILATI